MAKEFTTEELMVYPLLHFAQPNYKEHDNVFNSAMAFYYLVVKYRETEDDDIRARIIEHIDLFTSPGREPQFDVHAFHSYVPTTAGLALVKQTPNLFAALTKDQKKRVDVIMRAFGLFGTMYSSSDNWYRYNLAMFHGWNKTMAPNLMIPTFFAALGARYYAGSEEAFRDLLMRGKERFDYDGFIGELKECGFVRALRTFAYPMAKSEIEGVEFATIKDLMETREQKVQFYGITTSKIPEGIGTAQGIHFPYSIRDEIDYKPDGSRKVWLNCDGEGTYIGKTFGVYYGSYKDRIPAYLLRYIFNGGECVNSVTVKQYKDWVHRIATEDVLNAKGEELTAHTEESTEQNPSLGKDGMISEFDIGGRSDITYCYLDFAMATVIVSVCKELGFIDGGEVWERALALYRNGSEDLFYKDRVGYVGYNSWDQDYREVRRKDCDFPFYRVARMLYEENKK